MDCPTVTSDSTAKACTVAEKPLIHEVHDAAQKNQHAQANNNDKQSAAQATDSHVKSGNLPQLTIEHAGTEAAAAAHAGAPGAAGAAVGRAGAEAGAKAAALPEHHWYTGALNIAEDIGKGAVDEVIHHPLRVAESFAIGAGTAAIASVVATPVAIGLTVAGVGYGAYQIYKHIPSWTEAAKELNHPENYSATDLARAHQTWQNFGGGATDLAAAVGGGMAYRAASSAIHEALEESAEAHPVKTAAASSATASDGGTSNQSAATPGDGGASGHAGAAATPSDGGASSHAGAAATPGDGGASGNAGAAATPSDGGVSGHQAAITQASAAHHTVAGAAAGANPNGEGEGVGGFAAATSTESTTTPEVLNPLAIGEKAGSAAKPVGPEVKTLPEVAAPAMTPEEAALANSVKASQGIFNEALEDGGKGVVESTKQLYNVRFERVTEDAGRRLFTLENRSEGVLVPKGAFIATRLDAAGNPVIEDGIQNSWSIQGAKLAKTYQVDPETLAHSDTFVAPTRVDGPSVHMVQLDKPTEIITRWGAMKAKIGDWLANYDFDKATGKPGSDYAIVSGESYRQTYQPKPKL